MKELNESFCDIFATLAREESFLTMLETRGLKIVPVKEPEPEFKVGQWVWTLHANWVDANHRKARLFRINRILGNLLYADDNLPYKAEYCQLATPQEIESHLKKICDEKYAGKKFHPIDYPNSVNTLVPDDEYDCSTYCVRGHSPENEWEQGPSNPRLYDEGQWAEIIPEKKKLPKTREELNQVLMDWEELPDGSPIPAFLDQYDYED